jgi:hypothetical protein
MVSAEHVTDGRRGLTERAVVRQLFFIHRVEDTAVYGLQTVTHVGKRTRHDYAHRVFDKRCLHALTHLDLDDFLIFVSDFSVFLFHFYTFLYFFFGKRKSKTKETIFGFLFFFWWKFYIFFDA